MSGLTPREHALRVAVLDAIVKTAEAEATRARRDAEQAFAAVRKDGGKQQAVMLPDGTEIGLISIKAGGSTVTPDEEGLLAWVREHSPDDIEEYITTEAQKDAEVIDMIRACFPDAVQERVRSSARTALDAEMTESGGFVTDKETGEIELLGTVENHDPTGAFALNGAGAKARRDRIVTEWQRGNLREIALGPLALPAPGGDGSE
jgi:hypothetical protein